jgi:hypothetical protein
MSRFGYLFPIACALPGIAEGKCPPLPLRTLPITVGRLTIFTLPAPVTTVGAPPAISFKVGTTVVVRQARTTEALEITFSTGSWGPIALVQRSAGGAVLRTDTLLVSIQPPGQITYRYYSRGAFEIVLKSGNNEGEIISICEARPGGN